MQKKFTLIFFFTLFLCVTFLPIVWMFGSSFYEDGGVTLVYYRDVFFTRPYGKAAMNSLILASATTALSTLIGVPAGFFLSKTHLPFKNVFKICFLIPLIVPSCVTGIAWTNLLGKAGYLNFLLSHYGPCQAESISNFIYGVYGAVWILSANLFPVIMLVTEYALKNIDPMLEESGLVAGGVFQVLRKITFPLIAPAIYSGMMIVFVLAISEFGVTSLLQINVLPTQIFIRFSAFYNEKAATALAFPLTVITFLLITLEQFYFRKRSFAAAGRISSDNTIRYPAAWLTGIGMPFCFAVLAVCVAIPMSTLVFSASGLQAYSDAFALAKQGIANSVWFGFLGATFLTCIGFFLGYISEKISSRIKNPAASCIWLFFAVPATVLGVGLIKLCNRPEGVFQYLYGSGWIVILGYMARFSPLSGRIMANYLKQLPNAMEESGMVSGASWFRVLGRILLPLQGYGLAATWLISFLFCIGELGTTILVYPPGYETLPITLFTVMANSPSDIVSALALIMAGMALLPVGIFLLISKFFGKLRLSASA